MSIIPFVMTATGSFGAGVVFGAMTLGPRVIWRGSDATRVAHDPATPATRVIESPLRIAVEQPLMWVTAIDPTTGHMTRVLTPITDQLQTLHPEKTRARMITSSNVTPGLDSSTGR